MQNSIAKTIILFLFAAGFFTASFALSGCSDSSTSLDFPKTALPMVLFKGFDIPQFPTAEGQLNYAKSGFPYPEEKKAAFEFIFHIFPEQKEQCGNAALYIAYMNLGFDYRFAKSQDFTNAILAYQKVIKDFKGYPHILVKANWYLGWIYCDLLQDKKKGIPYYWQIIKKFPDVTSGISSPVPWVSLVFPLPYKDEQPPKKKSQSKWASISLLEIIRHAADRTEALNAFDMLWENHRSTVATGLAINLMLQNENHRENAVPYIEKYLALNVANPYLVKEIQDNALAY